jgi:hypothetical protein
MRWRSKKAEESPMEQENEEVIGLAYILAVSLGR